MKNSTIISSLLLTAAFFTNTVYAEENSEAPETAPATTQSKSEKSIDDILSAPLTKEQKSEAARRKQNTNKSVQSPRPIKLYESMGVQKAPEPIAKLVRASMYAEMCYAGKDAPELIKRMQKMSLFPSIKDIDVRIDSLQHPDIKKRSIDALKAFRAGVSLEALRLQEDELPPRATALERQKWCDANVHTAQMFKALENSHSDLRFQLDKALTTVEQAIAQAIKQAQQAESAGNKN